MVTLIKIPVKQPCKSLHLDEYKKIYWNPPLKKYIYIGPSYTRGDFFHVLLWKELPKNIFD